MPITYVDDTADAGQTDFLFSFDYLEDEHVTVFIDGVQQTIGADEDYTVQTSPTKKIVLNVAATGGEIVRVRRISDPATDLVDFVNGSVLTESELDRAYLHNRYLAEESAEQNDISLRVKEGGGGFDGLNKRLLNLSDPVDTQDAATKNYVDTNDALKVSKAGDSMSGNLAMGSNKITGLSNPSDDQDAATKDYVDDVVGNVAVGALPDDSVTYAKIQEVAGNNVLLGNDNGTNQNVQELTAAEVRTVLNVADGATANTGTVTSVGSGTGLTGGPITGSGTLSIDNGGVDEAQLADNAVTSGKISATDTNFNVTAAGKVGIGKVNSGAYQLEIDGDLLVQDTGDNFPAAIFAGSAGAAIQLNDQGTNGQVFNLFSNPEGVGGPGTYGIASIDANDAAAPTLTITSVTTTATEATYTFSSAHNIKQGERVQTFGSTDANWNVTSLVLSVGSTTTLTVTKPSATANYPATAKRVGTFTTFSIRKDYEANVLYSFLKIQNLPKDTSEPSWLESGQIWIDTTDMSLKIKDYA